MKLRSENGFTGTDIIVAIIVLLLFMSLISVVFFNITKSSKSIDRKSEATYIATNIIETLKAQKYDDVILTNNETEIKKNGNYLTYQGITGLVSLEAKNLDIETGYTCKIKIENYVPETVDEEKSENDLVKLVNVKVEYKLGGEIKQVDFTTTILRQI